MKNSGPVFVGKSFVIKNISCNNGENRIICRDYANKIIIDKKFYTPVEGELTLYVKELKDGQTKLNYIELDSKFDSKKISQKEIDVVIKIKESANKIKSELFKITINGNEVYSK